MNFPTDAEIDKAIGRIALTADGRLLYRRLQMILMSAVPRPGGGALRAHEGRRSLARELKALMDSTLSQLGPPRDRSGDHDPDEPAVAEPAQPIAVERSGIRRRVADYGNPS